MPVVTSLCRRPGPERDIDRHHLARPDYAQLDHLAGDGVLLEISRERIPVDYLRPVEGEEDVASDEVLCAISCDGGGACLETGGGCGAAAHDILNQDAVCHLCIRVLCKLVVHVGRLDAEIRVPVIGAGGYE